jgi:hypothetical protein
MLSDPQIGSYRGARFDWSGIISSLQYQGHEYFGQWYKHHDPTIHDAVTEPLMEFRTNDSWLGYEEAKPGDAFVRIGIFTDCREWRRWIRLPEGSWEEDRWAGGPTALALDNTGHL